MNTPPLPPREQAEKLAIGALVWLAAQPDLLPEFLTNTGASVDNLRLAAARPEFLGAVLDFILAEDARVVAYCDQAGVPYAEPMRARAVLPGGDLPHWT
ncbi:DUF3572 domain-containing protein [Falsirhodobacter xinxiangensis]|uniref:DUF3572 domain-containing protein n=1 Tax=Falsirhodobacter xinxiangensis TaxID=2530049 RepID=UPI0010AA2E87|nr:DUF3572 domain-containing protein [Rhodobacter xinxiangensis]